MQLSTGEIREVVPASAGWANDADLPLEHRLLRERTGENGLGVIGFTWADSVDRMLVPLPDGLYVLDPAEELPRCFLASDCVTPVDPQLEVRRADGSLARALTSGDWMVDRLLGVDGTRELAFSPARGTVPPSVTRIPSRWRGASSSG